MGMFAFYGCDGATAQESLRIQGYTDGAASAGAVPGKMLIYIADATGALLERMRINNTGLATFNVNGILAARVDPAGTSTVNATTIMTREKGDLRYINVGSTGLFADGTAAIPSISFSSDTNTGIYSDVPDTLKFTTNGAWAMSLSAANNLYFGSQNDMTGGSLAANRINIQGGQPAAASLSITLNNAAGTNSPKINFGRSLGTSGYDRYDAVATNTILGDIRFHGADGTTEVYACDIRAYVVRTPVAGTVIGGLQFMTGSGPGTAAVRMDIDDTTIQCNLPLNILANGITISSPAGIDSAILLNKPTSGRTSILTGAMANKSRWAIELGNNTAESGTAAGSDFGISRYNNTGTWLDAPLQITRSTGVTAFSAAIINGPSDATLKGGIAPLEGALAKVEALQGRRFHMLSTPDKPEIGLIAQEVEPVVPEVIQHFDHKTDETGDTVPKLAVDYSRLTALLIEAVKELSAKVTALEAQLATQ